MIPLTRPTLPKLETLYSKLKNIFKTGMITESKYREEFEKRCADFLGVKYVVAVGSGTSALILTIKCLDLKGEILLPSFTFTSDGHALLWCGLKPVFVDINPRTFNINSSLIEKKITSKTSAILPTHVFGNPCEIGKIQKIAKKYNLRVICDAAHAFGAEYKGKSVACFGDVSIYSLTPTKVLTTGEGGLIATNNKKLAHKLRLAKHNGDSFNRQEEFLGLSSRMSEFHAILGIEGLKILKKSIKKRFEKVRLYKNQLNSIPGISFQKIKLGNFSVYKDLTILIDKKKFGFSRDQLLKKILENKVETKVYFNPPLHKKRVYQKYKNVSLPQTEFISKHIMNLPLSSFMSKKDVEKVCLLIKKLYKKG